MSLPHSIPKLGLPKNSRFGALNLALGPWPPKSTNIWNNQNSQFFNGKCHLKSRHNFVDFRCRLCNLFRIRKPFHPNGFCIPFNNWPYRRICIQWMSEYRRSEIRMQQSFVCRSFKMSTIRIMCIVLNALNVLVPVGFGILKFERYTIRTQPKAQNTKLVWYSDI